MATCPTRSGCGSALTTSWTALAPARTRKTAISASISSRWRWLGAPRWATPPRSRFHKRPASSLPRRKIFRADGAPGCPAPLHLGAECVCPGRTPVELGRTGSRMHGRPQDLGQFQQGRRRSQGPARRDRRRAATTQWLSRLAPVQRLCPARERRHGAAAAMDFARCRHGPRTVRACAAPPVQGRGAIRRFPGRNRRTHPGPDGPAHRDLADGRAARLLDRSVVQADGRGSLGLVE